VGLCRTSLKAQAPGPRPATAVTTRHVTLGGVKLPANVLQGGYLVCFRSSTCRRGNCCPVQSEWIKARSCIGRQYCSPVSSLDPTRAAALMRAGRPREANGAVARFTRSCMKPVGGGEGEGGGASNYQTKRVKAYSINFEQILN